VILAFDTFYYNNHAKTVCLAFAHWAAVTPENVYTEVLDNIEDYTPGQFYKRELPCILSLLAAIPLHGIEAIVIDGFVYLDDEKMPGLGGYLYNALGGSIPVIGVAKSNFATIDKEKLALYRGNSQRPLYITAVGLPLTEAANNIKAMTGEYRMPALLKLLDGMTREGTAG